MIVLGPETAICGPNRPARSSRISTCRCPCHAVGLRHRILRVCPTRGECRARSRSGESTAGRNRCQGSCVGMHSLAFSCQSRARFASAKNNQSSHGVIATTWVTTAANSLPYHLTGTPVFDEEEALRVDISFVRELGPPLLSR